MELQAFRAFLKSSFGTLLDQFEENDEYGFSHPVVKDFTRVGFATNFTPEVIRKSADKGVQLILTHHDAWAFIHGMKSECMKLLEAYDMTHFYVHLPLDFAEFGTCGSLLKEIGITRVTRQASYRDGQEFIAIGEYSRPIPFAEMTGRLSEALDEPVKAWQNANVPIRKVGVLTGAGHSTDLMRQASEAGCDAYITGERTLYSVQYAEFIGLNLIVGSHTFTELPGVRSLAYKLKERFAELDVIRIEEEHLEC